MNIAAYIASRLKEIGVKYVFGIPGGPSLPYIEEFEKQGIEFIITASETAAGTMAEVTGRLTGIPGICHSTYGPGATNLATGVGEALLDRSPMIALTSEFPEHMSRRTAQMNIDHHSLFDPITKASVRMDPEHAAEILNDAVELATDEPPGPVHIGLPSDIFSLRVSNPRMGVSVNTMEQETIIDSEVAALLEYSRKPVLALGLSATRHKLRTELEAFLDEYPMPVFVTPMAKGIIDDTNNCYCGVLFHALSDRLQSLIDDADLIIGFGYDPVEYNYEQWVRDIPVVHFDSTETDMPDEIMTRQVTGRLEGMLEMISAFINHPFDWSVNDFLSIQESIRGILKREPGNGIGIIDIINCLQSSLGENEILTVDVGSHLHMFGQLWQVGREGNLLMTNGWSAMGFAIPAAIAAALNYRDKTIFAVTGDGGFTMVAGEIVTARRLNLRIVVIVLCDNELNLIKLKQEKRQVNNNLCRLYEGHLFEADNFLGVPVFTARDINSLSEMIEDYQNTGPVIISVPVDTDDYRKYIIR